MRLGLHLNLIHNGSCVEPMRVYPLCHHRPLSVHSHFEHPFLGVQAVYRAVRVVRQGRVQPDVGPGRDPGAMAVACLSVVQAVHVNSVAEDVGSYVAVPDRWHEFVVRWKAGNLNPDSTSKVVQSNKQIIQGHQIKMKFFQEIMDAYE